MNDFSMMKYYAKYQEAAGKLGRLKSRIKDMRAVLIYADDIPAKTAEITALEAEQEALEVEVDDLWCLAHTGRHREEVNQANTVQQVTPYGGFHANWPGR